MAHDKDERGVLVGQVEGHQVGDLGQAAALVDWQLRVNGMKNDAKKSSKSKPGEVNQCES